jgi:hypothetical protein
MEYLQVGSGDTSLADQIEHVIFHLALARLPTPL